MEEGKMSHPRFESMLFERDDLKGSDRLALEDHLQECDACRRLASQWASVEARLTKAPMLAPITGFSARFQARLMLRRRKRRSWIGVLLGLGGASILITVVILFGSGILGLVSPSMRYMLKSLSSLILFGGVMQVFTDFAGLIFERLVANITPGTWLTYSAIFSGLATIWFATMYRLNFRPSRMEVGQ
jgi:hypothetical protein